MKSLLEVLKATTVFFEQKGFSHPRREAEELFSRALKISRMQLYLEHERPLSAEELELCRDYLRKRLAGEPFAYIEGKQSFLGCELMINSSVLIPRQETEILADQMCRSKKRKGTARETVWQSPFSRSQLWFRVALVLAIKRNFPELQVCLSDFSSEALAVAKKNSEINQLDVQFYQGDLLTPFQGQTFDLLVCNPPYISEFDYEELSPEVKNFEPKCALVSGKTGLEVYQILARELPKVLRPNAKVWFEIGYDQGESVPQFFVESCWKGKLCLRIGRA